MTSLNPPSTAPLHAPETTSTRADSPPWFDRIAWPLFGAAAVVATFLILWLGRGRTLSADEMTWFMQTPDLDLGGAFEPHVGHLILTSRLVYKAIFSTLGVGYLPFQLLTVGMVVLTAGLFFAYAGRRIGKLAALAPTLVLLVFGSDSIHLLSGNGFTVIGALACGLGALVALDRDDRTGDAIACALLCLGVVTYSVALPFVVGAAVSIALRGDRWRRAWIVVIPVAIYVAWWLWALGSDASSESQIALSDVLLFPSWAFQSLSSALGALAGFDYSFGNATFDAGPTLAVLALIAVGWRFQRGPVPKMLWAVLAIVLSLWLMGAVSKDLLRTPDSARYLYPGALVVLIVGAWAAAGLRWRRPALIALFILAATGAITNIALLRDNGGLNRVEAAQQRAILAGIEIAGPNANPSFVPDNALQEIKFSLTSRHPAGAYLDAVERYGSIGYSPEEVRGLAELPSELTDQTLAGALGLSLLPSAGHLPRRACVDLGPDPGAKPSLELAPGQTLALESEQPAAIAVGRFADNPSAAVGTLQPGEVQTLAVPADGIPDPWHVSSAEPVRARHERAGSRTRVCQPMPRPGFGP